MAGRDFISIQPRPSNHHTSCDPHAPVEQALVVWPHAVAVAR
jgi:hypothetical protein